MDVLHRVLEIAADKLHLDRLPPLFVLVTHSRPATADVGAEIALLFPV